jgi:hypothetical protein
LCLIQEDIENSIKFLEKSNRQLANNSEVLRNLGFAYTITGQYEK